MFGFQVIVKSQNFLVCDIILNFQLLVIERDLLTCLSLSYKLKGNKNLFTPNNINKTWTQLYHIVETET